MQYISSRSNEKIKQLVKLSASSKQRREQGLFVLEGARLCFDGAISDAEIESAFFTGEALEKYKEYTDTIAEMAENCYEISKEVSAALSDTKSPQGVFCLCRKREKSSSEIDCSGCYIALDNLQDPSNLGAAARTAEALGIDGLIVSGGCDIYSPKAQRAAMGALMRINVIEISSLPEFIKDCRGKGMKTYASTPANDCIKIDEADFSGGAVCVIGNEGAGVSEEVFAACESKVTIPMAGRAESLNASAAASIIMWELAKRRRGR